jgi:hypothetical protein
LILNPTANSVCIPPTPLQPHQKLHSDAGIHPQRHVSAKPNLAGQNHHKFHNVPIKTVDEIFQQSLKAAKIISALLEA